MQLSRPKFYKQTVFVDNSKHVPEKESNVLIGLKVIHQRLNSPCDCDSKQATTCVGVEQNVNLRQYIQKVGQSQYRQIWTIVAVISVSTILPSMDLVLFPREIDSSGVSFGVEKMR